MSHGMEMNQLLVKLRRYWWLALIPVIIVAFVAVPDLIRGEAAGSGGYSATFRYSAAQEASNLPNRDGDYQDVWLASEFVVNAFTDWVRSSTFRDELKVALPETVDLSALGVSTDNSRSIGVVQMSHPDAEALGQIVSAAVTVLQTRNAEYFPHLGGENAEVAIVDAPVVVPVPPSLPNRFRPLFLLGVAAFLGVVIAVMAAYLDPYLRTQRDVELAGLRIMSAVPRYKIRR